MNWKPYDRSRKSDYIRPGTIIKTKNKLVFLIGTVNIALGFSSINNVSEVDEITHYCNDHLDTINLLLEKAKNS